jgi:glycosyltransferase involved in cell wall biosynthesis
MLFEPKITVITICYNTEAYVAETIESVLNQRFKSFEYIIVDDNSTDASWGKIKSFNDARIKSYRNEKNLGEYRNRNKAIDLATGDYIIFIDGDDIMYPNAIETFYYYIKLFPEAAMFFCRSRDPRILCPYKLNAEDIYRFEYFDRGIMGQNFTQVLFKRSKIIENGYFPEHISTGDAYMQLKISLKNWAVVVNDGLTWWRRRRDSGTERFFKNETYLAEELNYKIDFLNDASCPLNENEKDLAKIRIYGSYLRKLLRMIIKFKIKVVPYLLKNIKIPKRYYKSVLVRNNHLYFGSFYGEKPLHTVTAHVLESIE